MTTEEKLDHLTGVVNTLASTVVAHDNNIEAHDRQIAALIDLATKQQEGISAVFTLIAAHDKQLAGMMQETTELKRQLQAYLTRLPRQ